MIIYLIGLNHNTAPLETRERVAISQRELERHLGELCNQTVQGVILSTCNRTEFYLCAQDREQAKAAFDNYLVKLFGTDSCSIINYLYFKENYQAASHLFHVVSGLESMIIGECEVLGQVKNAFKAAEKAGTTGICLRKLFNAAIKIGRRVREETAISRNSISVSSVAVEIALQKMGRPENIRMLIIGSGEAGKLVARVATGKGIRHISVAGRYSETINKLSKELGVKPVNYETLDAEVAKADCIITCTEAPHYLLRPEQLQVLMDERSSAPLVIIDIGVPRNVDPVICKIKGIFLFNIDDIGKVCDQNQMKRSAEINMTQVIITEELERFKEFYETLNIRPIIRSLTLRAEQIRTCQLDATLKNINTNLSEEEVYKIDAMTKAIVNRILQEPIFSLKENSCNPAYADVAAKLFKINEGKHI